MEPLLRSLLLRSMCRLRLDLGPLFVCMLMFLMLPVAKAQMFSSTNSTAAPMPGLGHDYIRLLNETVNPANGSVSVNINFPMPKGRGLALPFSINYNSGQVVFTDPAIVQTVRLGDPPEVIRNIEGVIWSNNSDLIASGGWVYGLPFANWINGEISAQGFYIDPNGNTQYCPNTTGYVFRDMSGTSHSLHLGAAGSTSTARGGMRCVNAQTTQGGDDFFAASITYDPTDVTTLSTPLTVSDLATGTTYKFGGSTLSNSATQGRTGGLLPDLITDHNGNQISVTQSNGPTGTSLFSFGFTDSLKHTVLSDNGFRGSPEILTAGDQSYTVKWRQTSANYSVPHSANLASTMTMPGATLNCAGIPSVNITPNSYSNTLTVISSITLPNGQAYRFYYGDDNPNGLGNPYGRLSEIDYPDGGSVQYTWTLSDQYSDLMDYPAGNDAFAPPGTVTNFSRVIPDGCLFRYSTPMVATRTVFYAGTTPAESQTFTYATAWTSKSPGWDSKTTSVTTSDIVAGQSSLKQYNYSSIYQGLPVYAKANIPPQISVEQSVSTYDWGNTSTPVMVETKAWYDEYELACDFTTLNGSLSAGHFFQYGLGAQVTDDKEYAFGQVSNPASACAGSGTNTSLGAVPPPPSNPVRETATAFQTFTNPLGTIFASPQSVITYDSNGAKAAETDLVYDGGSLAGASAVQHDDNSFSASAVTGRGNVTSSTRQCLGCVNATTSYVYDATGQVVSSTDPCSNASCAIVNAGNHTTNYAYTDSPSNSSGNTNAYLTQVTNPLGQGHWYSYNYGTGQLATATDVNGQTTRYTYNDPLNRLTNVSYPDGGATSVQYNDSTPSVTTSTLMGPTSVSVMDGMRHVVQTQLTSDPGVDYVDTVYNGSGQVSSVSNPYRSTTSDKTTFSYDALGRKVLQTNPDQSFQQWCYNGIGGQSNCTQNKSSATNVSWVDFSDESGNHRQSASDSLGHLLAVVEPNPASGASTLETGYTYDSLNNLLRVTQKGAPGETPRVRNFTYDSLSRLITSSNPETGIICYGSTGGASPTSTNCSPGYDANGNLSAKTDARGQTVSYVYDALNRVINKTLSSRQWVTYYYDTDPFNPGLNGSSPNLIGRLALFSATEPTGAGHDDQYFGYDSMGRLKYWSGAPPSEWGGGYHTISSGYDLAGNMTSLTYPNGLAVTQTFNAAGRLYSSYPTANPQSPYVKSISYLPLGSPQTIVYGNGPNGSGVTENFTQNSRLQPCESNAFLPGSAGGNMIIDRQYFYSSSIGPPCGLGAGNNGNIFHIVDGVNPGRGSNAYNQDFLYDSLNRLTDWQTTKMAGQTRHQGFSYDSFGNILNQTSYIPPPNGAPDPLSFSASYGPNNRILPSGAGCTPIIIGQLTVGTPGQVDVYDAAGNLGCTGQNLTAKAFVWDAESRLSQAWSQQNNNTYSQPAFYSYDAVGNRVRADQMVPGQNSGSYISNSFREYSFFGGQMLAEKSSTVGQQPTWTNYIYAAGKKIARVDSSRSILHLHGTRDGAVQQWGLEGPVNGVPQGVVGLVLQTGDKLVVDEKQNIPTYGGLTLITNNRTVCVCSDGDLITGMPSFFNSFSDGKWHHFVVDLSPYQTQNVTYVVAGFHNLMAPTGTFDLELANAAIVRADGTVLPILNGQGASVTNYNLPDGGGANNLSSGMEITPTPEPEIATTYYLANHLGTTQMEFSAGGSPVSKAEFAPFGQELDTQTTSNRYKFTGKERDIETGLDYFGARYYASSLGRWMSPDWAAKAEPVPYAKLDNPQTLNLYGYVNNNPLSKADPDGHCPWCLAVAGGGVLASSEEGAGIGAMFGGPVGAVVGGLIGLGVGAIIVHEINQNTAPAPYVPPGATTAPYPGTDPTVPPGPGFVWVGPGPAGTGTGSWHNPTTGESIRPDLAHPGPIGPHYDHTRGKGDKGRRLKPNGTVEEKGKPKPPAPTPTPAPPTPPPPPPTPTPKP